jgi:hypothetical protein
MKCQSYRFLRGSDFLRIEAISHIRGSHSIDPATKHIYDNMYGTFRDNVS